jgi:uncharacterized phage protein (TIGR02220 family)
MDIIELLANDNYIIANKTIAKRFGLDEAILLGELASEYRYWLKRGELADGYFYSTIENVKENTTLSDKRQRSALTALKDAGIVDVKLKGLPAKRYIKLNAEQLLPMVLNNVCQNSTASSAETANLDTPKKETNNNNLKNNKNSNNKDIYIAILARLNEKAGTSYRHTSKATQSHINARLAEGYTVEDFYAVIDKKCAEWKGGEMEKYLRPETLFGNKFENYLNAPAIKKQAKTEYKSDPAINERRVFSIDDFTGGDKK